MLDAAYGDSGSPALEQLVGAEEAERFRKSTAAEAKERSELIGLLAVVAPCWWLRSAGGCRLESSDAVPQDASVP